MERIYDQSKSQSNSLSPSRSPSTSRTLARSKSLRSEFEHPSHKSPSETQPILSLSPKAPEVQSLIGNLERVSIFAEKAESCQISNISISSSLKPRRILT